MALGLNKRKTSPHVSPRIEQKQLRGVGCASARRPGSLKLQKAPREPVPSTFICTLAAHPPHLRHRHPQPAAPHAPPACGASHVDPERGRDVNTECERRLEPRTCSLIRAACVRVDSQSKAAFIRTALTLLASKPGQHTLAEDALAQGLELLKGEGGARAGGGAFTRAPSVSSVPRHSSLFSSRHSEFICLQADYVSSSLSSRPLDPPPAPYSRPLLLRICLRHNGAISGLAGVGRHAPATPLPFRGAIKSAARRLLLFARRSWKCRYWEVRRLRRWRWRRLGKSERCDRAAVARLFLCPAASRLENNFLTIKKREKK
ncbi:hypothetical protein HPG69_001209 [Diceros bicornis minor]|uniref:Uncharacterized protein n=1 Tax=Diceros bicornis minor TaxID=77932 RepID=A0A7J7FEY3_DICBM|nr:hypothetical protein HPG69_001209 [Diceros bicornis minor]